MPDLQSRLFARADLPELLSLVNANARSRWREPTYLLSSDVAWQLPGSRGDLKLWYDANGPAAYAWFGLIGPSTFDLRTDIGYDSKIAADVLHWLEVRRHEFGPRLPWLLDLASMQAWEQALDDGVPRAEGEDTLLQIGSFDRDGERVAWLQANGFQATEHFNTYLARSLDESIPEPSLPDGWQIRSVQPPDFEARVQVHRDSWHRSRFSLEQYLAVRAIDVFDPDLDLVALSPNGEFASYCIGWIDSATGIGSFEPVGTPPAWRRRGLGQQVQYEGLRRMRSKGMSNAKIHTAGFNDRAYGLYTSCGFKLTDRERTYIKTL